MDVENVAVQGQAQQSGLSNVGDHASGTADKAVDGDRNTCSYADTRYMGYTPYGAPAWWKLDLGEFAEYDVIEVIIHTPAAIADRSKLLNMSKQVTKCEKSRLLQGIPLFLLQYGQSRVS